MVYNYLDLVCKLWPLGECLEMVEEGEKTNSKMSGFNWVINSASALWDRLKIIELFWSLKIICLILNDLKKPG